MHGDTWHFHAAVLHHEPVRNLQFDFGGSEAHTDKSRRNGTGVFRGPRFFNLDANGTKKFSSMKR
jgi:hypothetical protein